MADLDSAPDTERELLQAEVRPLAETRGELTPEIPTKSSSLASFIPFPSDIEFKDKNPGEKILLLLRQHPAKNLRWVIGVLFALVFSLMFLNPLAFKALFGFILPLRLFIFVDLALYLLLFIYTFERFLFWFFNVYIVTDRRLIDIDFQNLLLRRISDTHLYVIQDVTYHQQGLAESILNYGDVLVQTAASETNIDFVSVPKPGQVAGLISDLIHKQRR